ncbi:MAG: signal recognition particle-docking protein FtsY [Methanobacterium sp.]|nr:signal recognition particle-docking protein FtsY [Methanobacterium sp.]
MFESLKKKLSGTIGQISEKISKEEEEAQKEDKDKEISEKKDISETPLEKDISENEEDIAKPGEEDKGIPEIPKKDETDKEESKKTKKTRISRPWGKSKTKEKTKEEGKPEDKSLPREEIEPSEDEKSGLFSFVRHKTISENDIDDILFELEMSLLEGDVALEVAEQIINTVKEDLVGRKIKRRSDVAEFTRDALKKAISDILAVEGQDLDALIKLKKKQGEPLKLMFVGINGTGKTTSIAKVATYFIDKGYKPVIAASDTFRAGAIEQLTHHADKIGVKIIKHKKGADPAAVAFDAVEHARAQGKELVLVDTAGRMQTNVNLMDEMKKIKRVINPDLILFVGDALTGNDAVEQARKFDDAVGIDGIILTKADADAKGGAALSIGHVINKPILFLGTGQSYSDIMEFRPEWMVEQVFGEE